MFGPTKSDETTTALSIGNVYGRLIHVLEISSDNPHLLLSNNISGLTKPGEVGEILSLFRLDLGINIHLEFRQYKFAEVCRDTFVSTN
jgi:hypothetical protein